MFEQIKKRITALEKKGLTETESQYLSDIDKRIRELYFELEPVRKDYMDYRTKSAGFFGSAVETKRNELRKVYERKKAETQSQAAVLQARKKYYSDVYRDREKDIADAENALKTAENERETARKRRNNARSFDDKMTAERDLFNASEDITAKEQALQEARRAFNDTRAPVEKEADEIRQAVDEETKRMLTEELRKMLNICSDAVALHERVKCVLNVEDMRITGRREAVPLNSLTYLWLVRLRDELQTIENKLK